MPPSERLTKLLWEDEDALRFAGNIARGLHIGADLRQIRGYAANVMENFLEPHFALEEQSLIERLNPLERMHTPVREVLSHHEQFTVVKQDLQHACETRLHAVLTQFHELLARHVHYEERHFFPYIERCLDDEQLLLARAEIDGAQIADCRSWPDPYWKPDN